jgi:hypothetical protein
MLFRRIDLPLFRRKRKPRSGFLEPGETISGGLPGTSIPGRDETLFDISQDSSGDNGVKEPLSYISDESYLAIIENPYSPAISLNRKVDDSRGTRSLYPTNLIPRITLRPTGIAQTEASDNTLTGYPEQRAFQVNDNPQTTVSRQVIQNRIKSGLNQPIISGKRSRYIYRERISSRISNRSIRRTFYQQEIPEQNQVVESTGESPEIPLRDHSFMHMSNIGKKSGFKSDKPASPTFLHGSYSGNNLDRKSLKVPPPAPVELYDEIAADYDIDSYPMADGEQSSPVKPATSPDTITRQHPHIFHGTFVQKIGQSIRPRILNTLNRLTPKPLALQTVDSYEEVSAHYDTGKYPITGPGQPAVSKCRSLPDTQFEQNTSGIDRDYPEKFEHPSIPRMINKLDKKTLNSPSPDKVELSNEITANYDSVSYPLNDKKQPRSSKPEIKPAVKIKQSLPVIEKTIPLKFTQSLIPLPQNNLKGQSSKPQSFLKVEPLAKGVTDYALEELLAAGGEQSSSSKPETRSNTIGKRLSPTLYSTILRKASQPLKLPILNTLKRLLLKPSPLQTDESSEAVSAQYNIDEYPVGGSGQSGVSKAGTPLEKAELSTEIPDRYDIVSHPLTDRKQPRSFKSEPNPAMTLKKNLPVIEKTIRRESAQSSMPLPQNNLEGQSLRLQSFQKAELLAKEVAYYAPEELPTAGAEQPSTSMSETKSPNVSGHNNSVSNSTISSKISRSLIHLSPGIISKHSFEPLNSQNINRFYLYQTPVEKVSLPGQTPIVHPIDNQSVSQTPYGPRATSKLREFNNAIVYDREALDTVDYKGAGVGKNSIIKNQDNSLTGLETHVPDRPSKRLYPVIGNIPKLYTLASRPVFRASKHMPLSVNNESSVVLPDAEKIMSSPGHKYTEQKSLNLPLVSTTQPRTDQVANRSEEIFRNASETPPGLTRSPSYSAADLALLQTARVVKPALVNEAIVNQPQFEKKNNKETAQDIRIIAEKVYAILKHELKVERARERHHLLR